MTPRAALGLGAIALTLAAGVHGAQADTEATREPIALVYSAPAECPGDEAFRAEVRERASGDWEARPGELARRITVSVTKRGDGYAASIAFLNAEGETVTRSLGGQACADVVNGIALVTALAIQSRVEEALAQTEPEPAKPVPSATVSKAEPQTESPAPPRPNAAPVTHVRFGAAVRTASGVGPELSFGPAAFGAIEWGRTRFGVTAGALWSGRVTTGGVSAHFLRLSGRLDGCPYAFGTSKLALEPCGFFEAGSLHGEGDPGTSVSRTSGGASPWLVPGVLLRLVAGLEPMIVELELGGGVPLVRERFGVVVDGDQKTTFTVPKLVFDGALGVGLRL